MVRAEGRGEEGQEVRLAFERLALVGVCSGLVFGLVMLAAWQSWWQALLVSLVGVALAVGLVEVSSPAPVARPRIVPRALRENLFEDEAA